MWPRPPEGIPDQIRRISRLAVLTFLFVLLVACWWGQALLALFGITLEAFRVAGGLILLPIGLRLIEGQDVGHPDVNNDLGILGVVPIGLPLLAGPAAISLVVADAPASWRGRLALSMVITRWRWASICCCWCPCPCAVPLANCRRRSSAV